MEESYALYIIRTYTIKSSLNQGGDKDVKKT